LRATDVVAKGDWDASSAADRVVLDHDARHRRRFRYEAEHGTAFLLDLPRAVVLGDGDGLRLEDGRTILVEAAPEPLIEVRAASPDQLVRLAWHIGNRHLAAELRADRIRIRADHVIADMLRGLGAIVTAIEAPFTPEAGAYAGSGQGGHAHGHVHGHHHDHGHHHHDH